MKPIAVTAPTGATSLALKYSDLLWALAYPLYQTFSTLRHEAAHALMAVAEGAQILRFVFWPTLPEGGGIYWGYVRWRGSTSWRCTAAPYVVDLLTYALCFWLCQRGIFKRRWVRLNVMIIGMLSPLINSFYNYQGGFYRPNDVGKLLQELPAAAVHLYFGVTLTLYIWGLIVVLRRAAPPPPQDKVPT